MSFQPTLGLPGVKSDRTATPRTLLQSQDGSLFLPGGRVINGSLSRDPDNTGDLDVLRAGMIMGKITSSGKYAPSFIAKVAADYTSGATSLTVSAAHAVEISRRVGASGTLKLTHAPTASGTVVPQATLTYSAINTGTGVLTITNIGANVEEGALIGVGDGSEVPRCLLHSLWGVKVTDMDAASIDVPGVELLIAGLVDITKISFFPVAANTTLITWLKAALRLYSPGLMFSDDF